MKNTIIPLLAIILIVTIVGLLASLGVISSGSSANAKTPYEYKALNAQQMDAIGFRSIAAEEGIPVTEEGEINFPKEMAEKLSKVNVLPRTIVEVEKDGGWELVAVTEDNHYLFRRRK
ncbi:MAG: hypothetical protein KBF76_17160 [Verrucomicrobiales bacterium]|jgi:hypothetical protein|nr:hypothetical protein [Verrucomicrobiales bacterium]HQZ27434.1 hypothetical protein [Verrucomicrobiales bacterium]